MSALAKKNSKSVDHSRLPVVLLLFMMLEDARFL
jgi:hypothetical protein